MDLQDKIGREAFVDKIIGFVDSLKKGKNFCLAINGAWGSGKSFVLGLIEEKLSQKQEYIIIKYDAWENTFYSDPLIAILSCILDGLEDKLSKMKGYGKVAADLGKKRGKEIVDKLSENGGKIGFIAKIIKEISEVIPDLKNVSLVTDTKDNQLAIFKSYKSLLHEIKELLNKLTEKVLVSNEQTKLVILVDEIDRCLPDEQLKILERLHHLFDVKNCAVIVTMNQTCVAETVKTIYGIDGYEYLRKFFNFTFRLDTSANEYLKNLLEEYIRNFEKIQVPANEVDLPVKLAYRTTNDTRGSSAEDGGQQSAPRTVVAVRESVCLQNETGCNQAQRKKFVASCDKVRFRSRSRCGNGGKPGYGIPLYPADKPCSTAS